MSALCKLAAADDAMGAMEDASAAPNEGRPAFTVMSGVMAGGPLPMGPGAENSGGRRKAFVCKPPDMLGGTGGKSGGGFVHEVCLVVAW
jgi:hypothetical protein